MKETRPIISLSQVFILALLLFHFTPALPALCGEPPNDPILRLETGMHGGHIDTIGVDAKNRYLVSGSEDNTVRVWELPQIRLVTTLRPWMSRGAEGTIISVDISPDGNTIVAAGIREVVGPGIWRLTWKQSVIYIFDRPSGRMKKPIKGFLETVNRVKFSPDGRYLIAGLVKDGICIYRTSDWSLLKDDHDYKDAVMGLDFDGKGRLVTVAFDGFIRMYDADFQLPPRIKKVEVGNNLASVAFSPDGSKIAICYAHSARVDIHSSDPDLRYLSSVDTTGIPLGSVDSFYSVCWASDGSLFAGGNYRDNRSKTYFIRRWADTIKDRPYVDLQASRGTVFSLRPLEDGAIAFACVDGIGIFDKYGRKTSYRGWDIPDHLDRLLVSDDAKTVQFCFDSALESATRFSLAERLIKLEPERLPTLKATITEAENIKVEDWDWCSVGERAHSPKLNGKPLVLFKYESSYSFAICPDSQSFLLGTNQCIRLFNKNGGLIWRIPVVSRVNSINVAHNSVFVASFGDGTIRWYRVKDGGELLTFFPHRDNKRWILWTPRGYYDASIGGEDLIGWHVNKRADQEADFFPVSRFRSSYYRPDVIEEVLKTHDEDEAVNLADSKRKIQKKAQSIEKILPPVVNIISPSDKSATTSKELTVRYQVRSLTEDSVTAITALVDGTEVKSDKGINLRGKENEREIRVEVPERDCVVGIVAENRHGQSKEAEVRITWAGEAKEGKPVLYVLAIGVNTYKDKKLKALKYAAKDASDFAEALERQRRGDLYKDVKITVLRNEEVTRGNILKHLGRLRKETTINDVFMLFISGHGIVGEDGYYFVPADGDTEEALATCLSHSDLKTSVAVLMGAAKLIFLDTCRAGSMDMNGFINEIGGAANKIIVFSSAQANQDSEELKDHANGAFTKALIDGIREADYHKERKVKVTALDDYVCHWVEKYTEKRQRPATVKPRAMENFAVAAIVP